MDEPDRSSTPPAEADDQPPPSRTQHPPTGSIELAVHDATRRLSHAERESLQDMTRRVLAGLPNTGSVRVRIVDDHEMIRAHEQFSGIPTTTDVLTFDLAQHHTDPNTKALDTDLTICLDEAQRQADSRPHNTTHELLLYIIHGVLHCLGHDDHDEQDYQRMHEREDELLQSAGIAPLFSAPTKETRS